MPIEDVDFLKQNSIKQSYIFMVDSADRDRAASPTPAEYVVEFTTPFHNVVGVQVLHASIPRTMYSIDVRNNTVRFFIYDRAFLSEMGSEALLDTSRYKTAVLTPGDYTIQTLVVELNNKLQMHVNDDNSNAFISITSETTTNPPEVQSLLRFRCPYAFVLDMSSSTAAEALGFDLFVDREEGSKPPLERRFHPMPWITSRPVPYKLYHSVDLEASVQLGSERIVFEGPRGVVRKASLGTTKVAQQFSISSNGYLTKVFAALTTPDGFVKPNSLTVWELYPDENGSPGQTPIPLLSGSGPIVGYIPVSYVDGGLSEQDDPVTVPLDPGTYWLVLSQPDPDADVLVYFNDVPSNARRGDFKIWSPETNAWLLQDTPTGIHFELCVRIVTQDEYHVLTAPGMYSLIGERFIVLRCTEVEENSYRSLAYSRHCMGIAKIQLGVVGYSESRMDFSSVPVREFHPIGKLSRLTLRFETSSGQLYDFKGINHDLTFAINYYEPVQTTQFKQSILNPNYSGNVLSYLYTQHETASDDQDTDYNEDEIDDYRLQEARHLPQNIVRLDLEAVRQLNLTDDEESAHTHADDDSTISFQSQGLE